MQSKERLIRDFSELIPFVRTLERLDEEKWTAPIGEGKWTTRDVMAHIMLWDKYYFEEAIEKLTNHRTVTVQHLDFDEFNRKAVEYAKTKGKQAILDLNVHYRNELLQHLRLIPEEDYQKEYADGDGNPFTVFNYLVVFISHDAHHIGQLKSFLSAS